MDDAGPVLVLVVAGARELGEDEEGGKRGDTDVESPLSESDCQYGRVSEECSRLGSGLGGWLVRRTPSFSSECAGPAWW